MTPERWQRIDDLFDAALQLESGQRAEWFRHACGDDRDLEQEVIRLLRQDGEAAKDRFLAPSDQALADGTASWPELPPVASPNRQVTARGMASSFRLDTDTQGFTPKAAIAAEDNPSSSDELRATVQARLREIPIIHACISGVMLTLRPYLLAYAITSIWIANSIVSAILIGCSILLSRKAAFSLWQLRTIELAIMAMLAVMVVFYEYSMLLKLSLDDDSIGAHITMKNVVLICSLLILTFGVYVPKSWRQTAIVAFPLALLPLATMQIAFVIHPETFDWILVPRNNKSVPLISYGLDAVFLPLLAAISSFSAHVLSRLRRQVAETKLLGQYHLGKRIGKGGMGDVYLAEHRLLKRPCALKLIRHSGVGSDNHLARFERKVRLTATLSHPNTIEIYDYGRTEDVTYYYVMEYLPGLSLADLVEQYGPLPPGRVVYLLCHVFKALCEAHGKGLIHRDVKPSNEGGWTILPSCSTSAWFGPWRLSGRRMSASKGSSWELRSTCPPN